MTDTIRPPSSSADFRAFAALIAEYADWCRARYQEDAWFIDEALGHQSLAIELAALATVYGPPDGRTLLAWRGDALGGGVAYRRLADGSCEMKRLFVRPPFAGSGTGRRLCQAAIASARDDGFSLMRLDTGKRLTEAIAMYESLGFTACAPYRDYPARLLPYLLFMELRLAD